MTLKIKSVRIGGVEYAVKPGAQMSVGPCEPATRANALGLERATFLGKAFFVSTAPPRRRMSCKGVALVGLDHGLLVSLVAQMMRTPGMSIDHVIAAAKFGNLDLANDTDGQELLESLSNYG